MTFLESIQHFQQQFLEGVTIGLSAALHQKKYGSIWLVGMGGSAVAADLINDYWEGSRSISIIRDYALSPLMSAEDLVFFSSYSGNTEETLAAFEAGIKRKVNAVVLSHGGLLLKRAREESVPVIEIPESIQPRCAVGYFFGAMLAVLSEVSELSDLEAFLLQRQAKHQKDGQEMAKEVKGHVPIIYGPSNFYGTCRFWKIKFNENSKVPSFFNVLPEANHNEMVGWTQNLMKPYFIFLRSKFSHPMIGRRMDVMREIFQDKYPILDLHLAGENRLQEMFDSLAVADYASYYLALEYGVDPEKVDMVENFKKKLG
ncbi:MAG: bifunctional phosphoglucose/phosphomannose isomerase [Deltaproteobacteria bacterium]|nr:bifunctional phosphoglucose/phosphomannose isomerase [Deltaproteobacteria bacterium]